MWAIIGTWRMAKMGLEVGSEILKNNGDCYTAVEESIKVIENYPYFKSVGYGGLPNENGIVKLDAGYMRGDNFEVGAVAGITGYKNPISIAKSLSKYRYNSFLIGIGAEEYAQRNDFVAQNMLTPKAKRTWEERLKDMKEKNLSAYDGHDTVCVVALDTNKKMAVGTSTSGLFMKKNGRVGDSPLSGSGFYVDDEIGGAAATGLGEDILKGCLSIRTVLLMEQGYSPRNAAQKVIDDFSKKIEKSGKKLGAVSIVALDKFGNWGVGTNVDFQFAIFTPKFKKVYLARPQEDLVELDDKYMQEYLESISK